MHALATLLPIPRLAEAGAGRFRIGPNTTMTVEDKGLLPVVERFRRRFRDELGVDVGRAAVDEAATTSGGIVVLVDPEAAQFANLPATKGVRADGGHASDERYTLSITVHGVRVVGATAEGVHRGLTTLVAVAESGDADEGGCLLDALSVVDAPGLAWRGFSLDVVRTFFGVAEVKRVIALLDRYKFNVLHLHLTDDQGWRFDVRAWPRLATVGGRGAFGERAGGFYTQADLADIVAFAAERFITVVPEIDMPGHSGAVLAAYPELGPIGSDGRPLPEPTVDPNGLPVGPFTPRWLDPHRPETWEFVEDVLTELAALTPGRYLHIGGDEAFGMPDADHALFVNKATAIVRALGKEPIGWQEIVRADAEPGAMIQYWIEGSSLDAFEVGGPLAGMIPPEMLTMLIESSAKADSDLSTAQNKRARVVVSPTSIAYLDRPYAEQSTDADVETMRRRLGMPTYPATTIEEALTGEITGFAPDVGFEIAGFEAVLWCETVTDERDLHFLLLPRLAGLGHRAWSATETVNWDDLRVRLAAQAPAWNRDGYAWFPAPSVDWTVSMAARS